MIFFQKFLNKPVVKKFQNFEDLDLVVGNCEATLRGLRISPLIMAAQILVVFEIVFSGVFRKLSIKKFYTRFEVLISVMRLCQVTTKSCEFGLQI